MIMVTFNYCGEWAVLPWSSDESQLSEVTHPLYPLSVLCTREGERESKKENREVKAHVKKITFKNSWQDADWDHLDDRADLFM